ISKTQNHNSASLLGSPFPSRPKTRDKQARVPSTTTSPKMRFGYCSKPIQLTTLSIPNNRKVDVWIKSNKTARLTQPNAIREAFLRRSAYENCFERSQIQLPARAMHSVIAIASWNVIDIMRILLSVQHRIRNAAGIAMFAKD